MLQSISFKLSKSCLGQVSSCANFRKEVSLHEQMLKKQKATQSDISTEPPSKQSAETVQLPRLRPQDVPTTVCVPVPEIRVDGTWWCWTYNFNKRDSGIGVFLWILWNFYEHLFYRTPVDDCFWKGLWAYTCF